jgi:hypothetical protein
MIMVMKKAVEVDLFTRTHWMTGEVVPGAHGLFSHMNLPTESSIELEQVEFCPLHELQQRSERVARLWLVKREVVAVLVENRAGLGPSNIVRAGYTKPFPHWVRVLVDGFELQGQIQSGGRFEFSSLMFEGENPFLPLFDATLVALLFPKVRTQAAALLFNRMMVQGISLIPTDSRPKR